MQLLQAVETRSSPREQHGNSDFEGQIYKKLLKVHIDIMEDRLRLWLLRSLNKRDLATQDIFSFVKKQGLLRVFDKKPDHMTIKAAMKAKKRDLQQSLAKGINEKKRLWRQLNSLGQERNVIEIRKKIGQDVYRRKEKIKKKYSEKIEHYKQKQEGDMVKYKNKNMVFRDMATLVPKDLDKYKNLKVFNGPNSLPSAVPTLGPFLCDKSINLSKEELIVLNKDPKYSLVYEPTELKFITELERMGAKYRYNENSRNAKKTRASTAMRLDVNTENGIPNERIARLNEIFVEKQNKFIFNPIKKSIGFNKRGASDYKLNKSVKLPRPVKTEQEFQCEAKKQEYMKIFKAYQKIQTKRLIKKQEKWHNKKLGRGTDYSPKDWGGMFAPSQPPADIKRGSSQGIDRSPEDSAPDQSPSEDMKSCQILRDESKEQKDKIPSIPFNLTKAEQNGIKSLMKRIKNKEIIITSTDKSSRFAVLTREQYLKSGYEHTKKDTIIGWEKVKYLQSQVNGHMWWLTKIVGYAKDRDEKRMSNNIQGSSMEVPEMVLLIKDHKKWSPDSKDPVPSRPVVSGSRGINTHLSEWISEIMEPVAAEMKSAEVCSTEEVLAKFDKLNSDIESGIDTSTQNVLPYMFYPDKLKKSERNAALYTEVTTRVHLSENDSINNTLNFSLLNVLDDLIYGNEQGTVAQLQMEDLTGISSRPVPALDGNTETDTDEPIAKREADKNSKGWGGLKVPPSQPPRDRCAREFGPRWNEVEQREIDRSPRGWGGLNLPPNQPPLNRCAKDSENVFGNSETSNQHTVVKNNNENRCKLQTKIQDFFQTLIEGTASKSIEKDAQENTVTSKRARAQSKKIFNEKIVSLAKLGNDWSDEESDRRKKLDVEYELSDKNVPPIQDFDSEPVMIGGDVVALYPSMDAVATAELAAQSIRETPIDFKGIDYKYLAVYIYLLLGPEEFDRSGLSEVIPVRNVIDEDKKDFEQSNSRSLLARNNRNMDYWYVDVEMLSDRDKVEMVAIMIKIATLVMMSTTCYTFGGLIYLQSDGAGIGLRGSAAQAKITMGLWDQKWAKMMDTWKFLTKIFVRYIDDIRIYAYPVRIGWFWQDNGWKYDPSIRDDRTPLKRTCDELQKSFNSIFEFLRLTTECQDDFENKYLPTLDVETRIEMDGYIKYKFFSKPMKNNMVIQNGTGLSQDIVFSSLRQEVIRRLSNTCERVASDEKIGLLEDFTQLMINSGHKFTFIRSVLMQGLTKFEYMVRRSKMDTEDKMFTPLHRERMFKREERILSKYVSRMVWYTGEKLTDPYRQLWRKNIKYKNDGSNKKSLREKSKEKKKVECTTTFFVPPSVGSWLFKMIREKESMLCDQFGWSVKILEAPGVPLLMKFMTKFPISNGCPRGMNCTLCDNSGIKCSIKGVIYRAVCSECQLKVELDSNETGGIDYSPMGGGGMQGTPSQPPSIADNQYRVPTYVGETSRPWRERILEHVDGMDKVSPTSVFVQHWMEAHPTRSSCPAFKFEIIESYGDPLRRQICEALYIRLEGTLNRKTEFNTNELCRFEAPEMTIDQERRWKDEFEHRKKIRHNIKNFCDVMSNIVSASKNPPTNLCNTSRSTRKRSPLCDETIVPTEKKKQRRMETSTPTHNVGTYREISENVSPIHDVGSSSDISHESSGGNSMNFGLKSNLSNNILQTRITPEKEESDSVDEKKLARQTLNLTWAAVQSGIITRTTSLPNINLSLSENVFSRREVRNGNTNFRAPIRWRSNSVGSIDFSTWSDKDFSSSRDGSRNVEEISKNLSSLEMKIKGLEINEMGDQSVKRSSACTPNDGHTDDEFGGNIVGGINECGFSTRKEQIVHSPNGWGGVSTPTQPARAMVSTITMSGTQIEHSPKEWGGMHGTPTQPVADYTQDNLVDSRIIMGAHADPDLLASPANISKCVAKRKLGGKDYLDNSRRRRLSINEMCVSPNLRARDNSAERIRANTWTGSASKPRMKKTPKI